MADIWRQGEHIAIVGDTGSGKTYLESKLLAVGAYRDYVLVIRTKADDIKFPGYRRIASIQEVSVSHHYYLLEPPRAKRQAAIIAAFDRVLREGGWTVAIDELFYVEDRLKLGGYIEEFLTQGRSQGITVVAGMQRPVAVSRFALSQCTYLVAFETEGRDAKTLAEVTIPAVRYAVEGLRRYQFVLFNRRTKTISVSRAQHIGELLV